MVIWLTMAESASVAKLSIRHDAILHFMLANPTVPKGEVALRFNVSEAWLSVVCNSQAFLEARARLTDELFHESVLPLREKMVVAADKALDRMLTQIPVETDLDKLRKTTETVLQACGYSSPKGPPASPTTINNNTQINNFGNASPDVLARARKMIGVTHHAEMGSDGQILPVGRRSSDVAEVENDRRNDELELYNPPVLVTDLGAIPAGDESLSTGNSRTNQEGSDGSQTGAAICRQLGEGDVTDNAGDCGSTSREGKGARGSGERSLNPTPPAADLRNLAGRLPGFGPGTKFVAPTSRRVKVRVHGSNWNGVPTA